MCRCVMAADDAHKRWKETGLKTPETTEEESALQSLHRLMWTMEARELQLANWASFDAHPYVQTVQTLYK